MEFPAPLQPAVLLRRYKRFLADVRLPDGAVETIHCPNPGAMLGLADPGMRVWLKSGRGKLKWGWVLSEADGALVGIDTTLPNRLVGEALRAGRLDALAGYREIRPEVPYGEASRVDFSLAEPGRAPAFVEVKNVHWRRHPDVAEFPDCVTARGTKHLRELAAQVAEGARAVMLFVVQRGDCARFRIAADKDPAYATAFIEARKAGVEALCYACDVTLSGAAISRPLPIDE